MEFFKEFLKTLFLNLIILLSASAATLLFLQCTLKRSSFMENENMPLNNQKNTAMEIFPETIVTGNFFTKGDIDTYKLSLPKGSKGDYFAELNWLKVPDKIVLSITVQDEQNVLKWYNNNYIRKATNDSLCLKPIFLESGKNYYLRVKEETHNRKYHSTPEILYSFQFAIESYKPNMESESNDSPLTANKLELDKEMQGFYTPWVNLINKDNFGIEDDWFELDLSAHKNKKLSVTLSGVTGVNSFLEIYDDLQIRLATYDSNEFGEGEKIANFRITEEKKYFLVVGQRGSNADEPYNLLATVNDIPENEEKEQNDNYYSANQIQVNQSIQGFLNPLQDEDFFQFKLRNKAVLKIQVGLVKDVDPYISVFNEKKELIFNLNNTGIAEAEIMPNLGLERGIYYIKLENAVNSNAKDNPDNMYSLLIQNQQMNELYEVEINNTYQEAKKISYGKTYKGFISPRFDEDFYSFSLTKAPQKLRINCLMEDQHPAIAILQLKNNVLRSITVIKTKEKIYQINKDIELREPGAYYIKVFESFDDFDSTKPYILEIFQ